MSLAFPYAAALLVAGTVVLAGALAGMARLARCRRDRELAAILGAGRGGQPSPGEIARWASDWDFTALSDDAKIDANTPLSYEERKQLAARLSRVGQPGLAARLWFGPEDWTA